MSKRFNILISAVISAVAISSCVNVEEEIEAVAVTPFPSPDMEYESGVMYVKFTDDFIGLVEDELSRGNLLTKSDDLNFALDKLGICHMERVFPHAGEFEGRTRREGLHKWYKVTFSDEMPVTKASAELNNFYGFEFVEPVRKIKTEVFNDLGSRLWGLNNTSTPGADINVQRVWDELTVGNPDVIVSVVDTGIDLDHEDLAANCLETGHINTNKNSYEVQAGDHGTHVAGTIAAVSNNGKGVAGIAGGNSKAGLSGVKLMSCQIFGTGSGGNTSQAIKWGADHGAVISQNSWGYSYDSNNDGVLTGNELQRALNAKIDRTLKDAIDYFIKYAGCDDQGEQLPDSPMKGGVVIFAAGNDGIRNGCPANYEEVIAVGAVGKNGRRTSFSNYGDWVDIAAPGQSIYSTVTGNQYANLSGTSMACPHVSGVAALIVSFCGGPGFTNTELKEKLLSTTNSAITPPADSIGGMVNAYEAIKYNETGFPGDVLDLTLTPSSNALNISCVVSEDSEGNPNAGYLVVYSTQLGAIQSATPLNIGDAQSIYFENDKAVGEKLDMKVEGLQFEQSYYVKVYSKSIEGRYSRATIVQKVTTLKNNRPEISFSFSSNSNYTSGMFEVHVTVTDIDGHTVDLRLAPGSETSTLSKLQDGLWNLNVPYRSGRGQNSVTLIASDEYGLETSETIRFSNETP